MGAINTNYIFTATDTVTSAKMNGIIDETTITDDAILGTTLEVASGKLKVRAAGITSNELATGSVTTGKLAEGSVAATKLAADVIFVPSGAVMPFAMNAAPTGWLAANGAAVSRATYAALFAAIATTYGVGDGATTFNLPDLRGYFVRGVGTNSDGTVSGAFATKQTDSVGPHTHPNTISQGELGLGSGGYRYDSFQDGGDKEFKANFSSPSNTGTTETRPRNIAMLYCIKI
jgi:hypothetical protein